MMTRLRHICSFLACASLTLGLAAPAWGQASRVITALENFTDQNGPLAFNQTQAENVVGAVMDGPFADIDVIQTGAYNRIAVLQFGDAPIATFDQIDTINTAFLIQATNNGTAAVIQNGDFNAAVVIQDPLVDVINFNQQEREDLVKSLLFAPETTLIAPTLGLELGAEFVDQVRGGLGPHMDATRCMAVDPHDSRRCWFTVRASGGFRTGEHEARTGALGFEYGLGLSAFSFEARPNEYFRLGGAIGLGAAEADYPGGLGEAEATAWQGALFLAAEKDGAFGSLIGAYGRAQYETDRPGRLGRTTGRTSGDLYSAAAEAGYLHPLTPNLDLGPVVGVAYTHAEADAYTEQGNPFFVQSVGNRAVERLQTRAGLMGRAHGALGGMPAEARLSLAVGHDFDLNDRDLLRSRFAFAPNTTLVTPLGEVEEGIYGQADLTLRLSPADGLALELFGGVLFGANHTPTGRVGGAAEISF